MEADGLDAFDLGYFRSDSALSDHPGQDVLLNYVLSGDADLSSLEGAVPTLGGLFPPETPQASTGTPPAAQAGAGKARDSGASNKRSAATQKDTAPKPKRRGAQGKEASRLYRERKKQLEQELRAAVDALEQEKVALQRETNARMARILSIKAENDNLKSELVRVQRRMPEERFRLLAQLNASFQAGADDTILQDLISKIKGLSGYDRVEEFYLTVLACPSTVDFLASRDVFKSSFPLQRVQSVSLSSLAKRLQELVVLDEKQKGDIQSLLDMHTEAMETIAKKKSSFEERLQDSFQIKFATGVGQPEFDGAKYSQLFSTLEEVATCMNAEAQVWSTTLVEMVERVLSIRQQAQFFLTCEHQRTTALQIAAFWDATRLPTE